MDIATATATATATAIAIAIAIAIAVAVAATGTAIAARRVRRVRRRATLEQLRRDFHKIAAQRFGHVRG